jgi:hypothetical protein
LAVDGAVVLLLNAVVNEKERQRESSLEAEAADQVPKRQGVLRGLACSPQLRGNCTTSMHVTASLLRHPLPEVVHHDPDAASAVSAFD